MKPLEMGNQLKQIEDLLPKAQTWNVSLTSFKDLDNPSAPTYSYTAEVDDWRINVVDYNGKRSHNCDGAAWNKASGLVIRLSRELSEKAVRFARMQSGRCVRCSGKL